MSRAITEEDADASGVSLVQKMESAILGSLLTSLLVTPLDVVRVRLQSQPTQSPQVPQSIRSPNKPTTGFQPISVCCREVFWMGNTTPVYCFTSSELAVLNGPKGGPLATECAAEVAQQRTFTSTLDGLSKIARNEGALTLWRGLTPTLLMAIPANVIYFAGYDWLRTNKTSPIREYGVPESYSPLVAGSTARVFAAIAVSPIEMFRTRMQAITTTGDSASGYFQSTLRSMRSMVSTEGYSSLWRGLGLTLWRDVPFSAMYWWGYEYGRNVLTDIRERGSPSGEIDTSLSRSYERKKMSHTDTLTDSFIAGSVSGAFAALVTTPFDVGKTRQQTVRHSTSASIRGASEALLPEDQSMPRFLWHIFREQGVSGLFRGWAARCLKVAPACAIMISSYEIGKRVAGRMNERRDAQQDQEI